MRGYCIEASKLEPAPFRPKPRTRALGLSPPSQQPAAATVQRLSADSLPDSDMACVLPSIPSLPSLRSHEFRFLTESSFLDSLCPLGPSDARPQSARPELQPFLQLSAHDLPPSNSWFTARPPASTSVSPAAVDIDAVINRAHKRLRSETVSAPELGEPPRLDTQAQLSHPPGRSQPVQQQLPLPLQWADLSCMPSQAPASLVTAAAAPPGRLQQLPFAERQQMHRLVSDIKRKRNAYPDSPFADPLYLSSREASESLRDSLRSESSLISPEGLQTSSFSRSGVPAWPSSSEAGPALQPPPDRVNSPADICTNVNVNNVEACLEQLQTSHTFPCNLQLSLSPTLWRDFSPPNALMAHIGVRICEVASETSFHRSLYNSMNPRVVVCPDLPNEL